MTKKMIKISVFTFISSLIISSCSIQSRLYNKGFQVNWKKNQEVSLNEDLAVVKKEKVEVVQEEVSQNETVIDNQNSKINERQVLENDISANISSDILINNEKKENVNDKVLNKGLNSILKNNLKNFKSKKQVVLKHAVQKRMSDEMILLTILCFLLPFVAVGIKTNWDLMMVLLSLLLSFLFWIPGVLFALLVVYDKI